MSGVYTPQAVVNGIKEMVGSNGPLLKKTIDADVFKMKTSSIELKCIPGTDQKLVVKYSYFAEKDELLNIAVVAKTTQTSVMRGENEGRKLAHKNVVLDFKTVKIKTGNVQLLIPDDFTYRDCMIIAYVQDTKTGKVTEVSSLTGLH